MDISFQNSPTHLLEAVLVALLVNHQSGRTEKDTGPSNLMDQILSSAVVCLHEFARK